MSENKNSISFGEGIHGNTEALVSAFNKLVPKIDNDQSAEFILHDFSPNTPDANGNIAIGQSSLNATTTGTWGVPIGNASGYSVSYDPYQDVPVLQDPSGAVESIGLTKEQSKAQQYIESLYKEAETRDTEQDNSEDDFIPEVTDAKSYSQKEEEFIAKVLAKSTSAPKDRRNKPNPVRMPRGEASFKLPVNNDPLKPNMQAAIDSLERQKQKAREDRERRYLQDFKYMIESMRENNPEYKKGFPFEYVQKLFPQTNFEDMIAEAAEKLRPEPVNSIEEIVINFNELADTLAKNEIKAQHVEFFPDVHLNLYNQLYPKYLKLVKSFDRKQNNEQSSKQSF